ncbi:MAG: hypothetical protein V4685_03750 [Bacteroidota bacterium]
MQSIINKKGCLFFYCNLLLFFILLPGTSLAQGYKIAISSESTDKPDKGIFSQKHTDVTAILPAANGGFISLVKSRKDAAKFDNALLVLQDAGLNVIKQKEMYEGIKSANTFTIVKLEQRIFFLYGVLSKQNYGIYSQEINSSNLELTGPPVLQAEFEKINSSDYYSFSTKYSLDSSKVLLISPDQYWNPKKRIDYVVLSSQMTKLYSNTYTFDKSAEAIEIIDYFVSNDGTIFISSLINRKDHSNKKYTKDGGVKIPAYDFHLLKMSDKSGVDMILPTNGMFIETIHAYEEKNGYVNIAGIYKQDYDENPSGTYRLRFLPPEKDIKFQFFPFPAELASQIEKGAQFPSGMAVRYGPSKAIANGEELYLFEQYYTQPEVWGGTYRPTFYRDILFCSMLPNDTVKYTLIKKEKQKEVAAFRAKQASFYLEGDVFKLWYNAIDNEAKDKREGLYITTIDKNGTVLSSDLVVEKKQMEGFVINASRADRFGKGFITTAFKNEKGYLCRITPNE